MKKSIFVAIAVLMLCLPMRSFAIHVIGEEIKSKLSLKADISNLENGESVIKQRISLHLQKGDLGTGGEVLLIPENDYLRFSPYVTLSVGLVTPVMGLSTDSSGKDHISAGIQYFGKLSEGIGLFVDLRNFWGLNSDSVDFIDNFAALLLALDDKIFTGLDLIYDHYWESGDNWYLVGVPLGYKLTKSTTIFVRPSFDRYLSNDGHSDTYGFRVGANISF